jgi:hypothetical protein
MHALVLAASSVSMLVAPCLVLLMQRTSDDDFEQA